MPALPTLPLITPARAAAHESLYPRLAALQAQVDPVAAKRPELVVPAPVRRAAAGLLAEAAALLGRRQKLPRPGREPGYASLAVALGQARAALEGFEIAYSDWLTEHKCRCWRLGEGGPMAVRRLLPPGPPPEPARISGEQSHIKELLVKRMMASRDQAYEDGYSDAQAGLPPQDQPHQTRLREREAAEGAAARQKRRAAAGLIPAPRVRI